MGCGHTNVGRGGCYPMWSYMNFSRLGGLPGSLMLLGGFWAPELRRALTSQGESLTSRPSKLVPGSEKREAVTAGCCILLQVDGAAARLWHRKTRGNCCKLLLTVFLPHFSEEAICENNILVVITQENQRRPVGFGRVLPGPRVQLWAHWTQEIIALLVGHNIPAWKWSYLFSKK